MKVKEKDLVSVGGQRKEGRNLLETKVKDTMVGGGEEEHQVLPQLGSPKQKKLEKPQTQKSGWNSGGDLKGDKGGYYPPLCQYPQ